MARDMANEAAMPVIRSMYPSRSRGQMANEFFHFIMEGVELADKNPKSDPGPEPGGEKE